MLRDNSQRSNKRRAWRRRRGNEDKRAFFQFEGSVALFQKVQKSRLGKTGFSCYESGSLRGDGELLKHRHRPCIRACRKRPGRGSWLRDCKLHREKLFLRYPLCSKNPRDRLGGGTIAD